MPTKAAELMYGFSLRGRRAGVCVSALEADAAVGREVGRLLRSSAEFSVA
jgi:hypothetical protein